MKTKQAWLLFSRDVQEYSSKNKAYWAILEVENDRMCSELLDVQEKISMCDLFGSD